ncbi:prolyl oligopeptidase family serine peptidase [Variovorax sp. J2P1-59]|uniref:alpha/beta hydrolase family protein n=1 Tax=Variovorax flavidus TaxID=3053501 RepID=UPI002576F5B0|nr:prolyl oligopeptidase family serine peptidase [Variovorax sp. J2P1-59]MDM0075259.1 prolyl oligopeptidase family serine peptidase [Variovorax sp. J2P1-59]
MRKRSWLLVVLVLLVWSYFARPFYDFAWIASGRVYDMAAQRLGSPTLSVQRQAVIDRHIDQGEEILAYLRGLRAAVPEVAASPALDFSGKEAFARSAEAVRERLRQSLRYPPPGFDAAPTQPVVETVVGEDEFATYRELKIPVLPGVFATGLYLRPKSAKPDQKLPLVISAHGRGGMPSPTPDDKLQTVMKSHRDLAWDALRHGYAVWLPTYVHYGKEGDGFRDRLTVRAWEAGTSLPAIEIAKTVKALDVLLKRPDIDPQRVAMMGQSYGGFYTLYTTAIDPRIRVAAVAAYFNDREAVLDHSEPFGFLDWRFPDSLTLWRDPSVAALVAPRPLLIESGSQDQLFPIEGARKAAPEIARLYDRLGIPERFEFKEFVGRHDFDGEAAMNFIDQHMK